MQDGDKNERSYRFNRKIRVRIQVLCTICLLGEVRARYASFVVVGTDFVRKNVDPEKCTRSMKSLMMGMVEEGRGNVTSKGFK